MGCDIHMYVETYENGEWKFLNEPLLVDPYDIDRPPWDQNESNIPYKGRDYNLFGWLAGVRTSDINPLMDPRGIPDDASKVYRELVDHWGADGHSHSYYLLSEIDLDYDNLQITLDTSMYESPKPAQQLPFRVMIGDVWPECVKNLRVLGDPDKVRVVFFFDN